MQADDNDVALVLAAQAGDKDALGILLARHWPLLRALCRGMLANPTLAEDAAQEAALQALLSLDRLRRPERFGSWLGGIGLHVCRHWLLARPYECWSWEAMQGGRLAQALIAPQAGPEELAEAADLRERVRRAVAELPHGQRAAVALYYLSGLTYGETALQLGIEVSAVRTRLYKARQALRRQLWAELKEEEMAAPIETQFVEMRIADVRSASVDVDASQWPNSVQRFMVVLEEVGGARQLRLWIAEFEGLCLALHLEKVQTPRPVTYAFVAKLLEALDGRLREVRITELVHEPSQEVGVFYAIAVVEGPNGLRSLDARPSDALILATLTGAPIRVDPAVCEAAAAESAAQATLPEGSIGVSEIAARIVASWPGAHVASSARPLQ